MTSQTIARAAKLGLTLLSGLTLAVAQECAGQLPDTHEDQRLFKATVSADHLLEHSFLGFGVEWEYEGDRPENNLNNPVWTNHWPEMVRRVDFMRPAMGVVFLTTAAEEVKELR